MIHFLLKINTSSIIQNLGFRVLRYQMPVLKFYLIYIMYYLLITSMIALNTIGVIHHVLDYLYSKLFSVFIAIC